MLRSVLAALVALSWMLAGQDEGDKPGQPPASQPASQPATRTSPRKPEQARILEDLLRDVEGHRAKPILSVLPDSAGGEAADGAGLMLEGTVLIERSGRLVRIGSRSEFHFTADTPGDDTQNMMEILKNRWLEAMEAEAEAGVKGFVISAEVTRYRGRNYLLLRKYRRQLSHGNLGP